MKNLSKRFREIDSSGMYDRVVAFPDQVEEAVSLARGCRFPVAGDIQNVIICGMGGSAIGGDLAKDYLIDNLEIPVEVSREYRLPAYAGEKSLVLISSYSGNTEETISSMRDAIRKGAALFFISTGGEVKKLADSRQIPGLTVPRGYQPREALAFSFLPILHFLGYFCTGLDLAAAASEAVDVLRGLSAGLRVPDEGNEVFTLARRLKDHFPVIYSQSRFFSSVVTRWRSQLSENSEILSSTNCLPELDHNEIMGWGENEDLLNRCHVVFLKDPGFHERVLLRWQLTREIIDTKAEGVTEVESEGDGLLARMLSLIYKGDFVSLYLSYLYGVDPTPVVRIEFLKDRLSGN